MNAPVHILKGALLDTLRNHAQGRDHAVPLAWIAEGLNISWREVAALIESLRAEGILVGTARSKPTGAFWPVTDSDYEAALLPYAKAFFRMSQIYNRLRKVVTPAARRSIERKVQAISAKGGNQWLVNKLPPSSPHATRWTPPSPNSAGSRRKRTRPRAP